MVIHPKQIACHEIYAPTRAELARAERVLKAYAAAGATGAIRLDGELIDLPVVEAAKQLLRAAGRD